MNVIPVLETVCGDNICEDVDADAIPALDDRYVSLLDDSLEEYATASVSLITPYAAVAFIVPEVEELAPSHCHVRTKFEAKSDGKEKNHGSTTTNIDPED